MSGDDVIVYEELFGDVDKNGRGTGTTVLINKAYDEVTILAAGYPEEGPDGRLTIAEARRLAEWILDNTRDPDQLVGSGSVGTV